MSKYICLTIDIEADLRDPDKQIRLFDDASLYDQFSSFFQSFPVTGFLVTNLLETHYASALHSMKNDLMIEYEVHSHTHTQAYAASLKEIQVAKQTYEAYWGKSPKGYRAPNGLMTSEGITHLIQQGYTYDASIFPTIRMDSYGYNNLHLPSTPFWFETEHGNLLELPFGIIKTIRFPTTLSYMKLVGWQLYRQLTRTFHLPDVVVLLFHPYDLYIDRIAHHIPGWKHYAHNRNAKRGFTIIKQMIQMLQAQGYQFIFMSELAEIMAAQPDLPRVSNP